MAIITISREYGCEGRVIGRTLAEKLGYSYIDKQAILKETRKSGQSWARWEEEMGESSPSLWERFDRSFIGMVALEEKAVMEAAVTEKAVIVGRGGNYLLKGIPFALHVRLVAPLETRVANIARRDDISHDQALLFVKRADLDRSRYIRTTFGQDWSDPLAYDVVFDNSKLSGEEIVKLICDMVPDRVARISEDGRNELRLRTAVARVKAAVLTSPDVFIPTLEVKHNNNAIIVTGIVSSARERQQTEELAKAAAGSEQVEFKLHYRF